MKRETGLTLIELMVALTVLAILAFVAVPNFTQLVRENRVTTNANEIVTLLTTARSEATRSGLDVTVRLQQANNGWRGSVESTSQADPLQVSDREGAAVILDSGYEIVFSDDGSANGPRCVTVAHADDGNLTRFVRVARIGRVSVSSTDSCN